MMNQGWIKLHRKSLDHWLYKENRPHTKREAWEDLLLLCNHSDEKVLIGNQLIDCKRGQSVKSLKTWADAFNWTISKVRRFFILLEKENMIELESVQKSTRITICNYENYQNERNNNETLLKTKRNDNETQTATNKNDKNVNNEKKVIIDDIINYLNTKTQKKFRSNVSKTQNSISARLNEGFTKEDFVKVIDIKTSEWQNSEMEKYLRPETLFGTKFESYLNQKSIKNGKKTINTAGCRKPASEDQHLADTGF